MVLSSQTALTKHSLLEQVTLPDVLLSTPNGADGERAAIPPGYRGLTAL